MKRRSTYETLACFRSLTLFVSSCPTNFFSLLPKVIFAPHLTFQQLLRSHVWVLCFSASPRGCCDTGRLRASSLRVGGRFIS